MFISSSIKLFRIFIFLLVVFAVSRILFLFYFLHEFQPQPIHLSSSVLFHAFPLDISAACYLLFIPVIILSVTFFSAARFLPRLLTGYLFSVSMIYFLLVLGEIGVYQEMRVKVYYSAFARAFHPSEILTYLSAGYIVALIIALISASAIFVLLLRAVVGKFSTAETETTTTRFGAASLFLVISIPLLVIGCRGGLQPIAINEGEVCFSKNHCANDAAVNSLWSLVHSYIETRKAFAANTYKKMPDEEAIKIVRALHEVPIDTTTYLFKTQKPNVCILILEGWHADLIESLNGYKGITPNFEKLIKEGYLFTNIESSGHVSDQGIAGILSAYPALTFGSVINQNEKQLSIPCVGKSFADENYYTSFLYGGQLIYGGIRKFIYFNKFNSVTEQKNLKEVPAGKVGIHDSLMVNIWRDSLRQFPQPFFSCYFTLSTHVPYDIPTYHPIEWGDGENLYLNSAAYADRQLGRFFEDMKNTSIYDSTIFILVSDHGHHTPNNHAYNSPEHYHIPVLIWGGALKEEFRGLKNKNIGSQTDVASTLLHQLGIPGTEYTWSKDLLNPYTKQFAFYTFNDGFGFVDTTGYVIWDKKHPTLNKNTGATQQAKDELDAKGAAILQVLMDDFLKR